MTTRLDKILKRELMIDGRAYSLALSPEGLKLTLKGKRIGQELRWADLVSGDAALAVALNASVRQFSNPPAPVVAKHKSALRQGAKRLRHGGAGPKRR